MSLTPGTRLGPYEIGSALGAGGMGEVYRARDTKLGRDVAIKVLPDELFEDKETVARFEREAQALASLNHPAIAVIHAFEEISGRHLLVQEFLEGETLRERLSAGALPARKALDIGAQIARGLAAAHEKGVVHRDLKPENLFVTRDGHIKILDFGLARQVALPADGGDTRSPTLVRPTEPGVILGTVAYMSPEQVRGLPVDHRADIFALGCVLYEMVSGRRPFSGDSAIETMHAVARDEAPDLPAGVRESAPGFARLIATCLAKKPGERWQSAADLARELSWLGQDQRQHVVAAASSRLPLRWLPWTLATLGVAVALIAVLASKGHAPRSESVIRFSMQPPEKTRFERNAAGVTLASSPDGRSIALLGSSSGRSALWLWSVVEGAATRLADTDGAVSLFWSPDGLFIGFFGEGKLKKVAVSGGPAQVVCEAPFGNAGTWSTSGVILFSETLGGESQGIYRVPQDGGRATKLTLTDGGSADATRAWPVFLPNGTHFLYVRGVFRGPVDDYRVCFGQLESPDSSCLMQSDSRVAYAPPGLLLFVRKGTLLAQPFDAGERRVSGQPAAIADRIAVVGPTGSGDFSTSADGRLLVYRHGVPPSRLVWMDRSGRQVGSIGEPGYFGLVRISPDGGRLVADVENPTTGGRDVWLYDLSTGIGSRLTFDPVSAGWPVWSPDGGRVAFGSGRRGPPDIYVKELGGPAAEKIVFGAPGLQAPSDWTRDGRFVAYVDYSPSRKAQSQIWLLPMTGEPKPVRLDESPFSEYKPRFSPDSRFIAFVSEETGQAEVYVAALNGGRKQRVSPAGGSLPCWSADGKELFFQASDNVLMSVALRLGQDVQFSAPKPLFSLPAFPPFPLAADYDVSRDGQRFLVNLGTERASQPPLIVTLGWQQRLVGDRPGK
jgi:serine/threonine protein kinase/Tol biopolymer transport system component